MAWLTDAHDANTAYDMFHDKFSQIYNDCIPLITKKISLDRPYKPWITKGVIKSTHKKSRLYKEAIKTKTFLSIKVIKINWSKLLEMWKRFTLPIVSMTLRIILKMSGMKLNNEYVPTIVNVPKSRK